MSASVPPQTPGAAPDPSMEDILASIRRILSEDEQAAKPPEPEDDDVLPLDDSMMVAEPAPDAAPDAAPDSAPESAPSADDAEALLAALSTAGEPLEIAPAEAPAEPPPPLPTPPPVVAAMPPPSPALSATDRLIAPEAEAATASSVTSLLRTIESGRQQQGFPVYGGGPTLEDMVREELRALLKTWLDSNLPPLVERLVRTEIERLVGRAVG